MGCCLSKTDPNTQKTTTQQQQYPQEITHFELKQKISSLCLTATDPTTTTNVKPNPDPHPIKLTVKPEEEEKKTVCPGPGSVSTPKKKEVFVIQHRKSTEKSKPVEAAVGGNSEGSSSDGGRDIFAAAASGQGVRTSSCTKEEVDAILIQCGRLSRSSSGKGGGHGRRYSGSKRSFDFDRESREVGGGEGEDEVEDERSRRRMSRGGNRRRSTPSRSRERGDQQTRSGSRERGGNGGSRRVSRSPARRSESPLPNNGGSNNLKPGKLVSVPATVTSLSNEKGGGGGGDGGNVKRVLVKRNVGSPRSQSPARGNGNGSGQQQQQASLSRNGSRKAEQSPYRRTPLNELDVNSLPFQPLPNKRPGLKGKEVEEEVVAVVRQPVNSASQANGGKAVHGTHRRTGSRGADGYEAAKTNYCRVNELQNPSIERMTEDTKEQFDHNGYDALLTQVIVSGSETLKLPQTLMRSRSSRRSRDLDINVEALLSPNPPTNYTSLLLQDIQKFHQKNSSHSNADSNASGSNNTIVSNINSSNVTLPPCVTKACSILEAVADLNSTTGPSASLPYSDDKRISPRATAEIANYGRKMSHSKDPFVESEVIVGDDLMEPSLHKYVTVRKRGETDEESSGSNSVAGHQNWVPSSSWEPTSADSTDCWTSKSNSREEGISPMAFQRHAISDFVCGVMDEGSEKRNGKNGMEKFDHQQAGAARARLAGGGGGKFPVQTSRATAASM